MTKITGNIMVFSAALLLCSAAVFSADRDENLQKVYSALELKQADHDVLDKLADGTENIHENEFFWMMKKVSPLPPLSPEEMAQLDAPSWKTMISAPQRVRFLPIRMTVSIYTVQELSVANRKLIRTPYWPSDKPIYRIHATNTRNDKPNPEEPLVIFTATLPPNLPEQAELQEDGQSAYKTGPIYEVAGVFYKYIETANTTGTFINKYPVVLVWEMKPARMEVHGDLLGKFAFGIAILIIALAIAAFMFLRKKVKRQRADLKYKELFGHEENLPWQEDEDNDPMAAIPPELAEAAKKYRQEHPDEQTDAQ